MKKTIRWAVVGAVSTLVVCMTYDVKAAPKVKPVPEKLTVVDTPPGKINFQDAELKDGTLVQSFYRKEGVMFRNALVLTAGKAPLDTDKFSYRPETKLISEDKGPIFILFRTGRSRVAMHMTYDNPVKLTAYDNFFNPLGTVESKHPSNCGKGGAEGSVPDELLELKNPNPLIYAVRIDKSKEDALFVLSDLEFSGGKDYAEIVSRPDFRWPIEAAEEP